MKDKTSNLMRFADEELKRIGADQPDSDYNGQLYHATMSMVGLFASQNHSGASAGVCISFLQRLLRFEPLSPLTGEDNEWIEVGPGVWQNRRCAHVFKDATGKAYDAQGIVFQEPTGLQFTNQNSRVEIKFPYSPTSSIVKVTADGAMIQ